MIIGTAGHIDHGKTSLVEALTGIDTDRLPEEKRRGITLELGFAHLPLDDGQVAGVVDVPGHERFVKAMAAGAGGVDVAVLVVAADEGVMPQTREHLDILDLLAIPTGIIVVTKRDLVDDVAASGDTLEMATTLARKVGAKEIMTACLVERPGGYAPDFCSLSTQAFIVFPWDYEPVAGDDRSDVDPDQAGA